MLDISILFPWNSNAQLKTQNSKSVMAFNASVILSAASEKHLGSFAVDFASQVLSAASEKYGFSLEEARSEFLADTLSVQRPAKKSSGPKAPKKEKKVKPDCILPFCGQKMEGACCGIRLNHQLFTQCTNLVAGEEFCKTCQAQADKNGGKPTYGTIADRLAVGSLDYQVNGKKVVRFSKVMDKLKITQADALRVAAQAGVEIAAEQFEVVKAKKGRPAKDTSVSDTDSAKSSKASKKGPGRPKKSAKVVKSETSDDLIAALVAEATPVEEAKEEVKETVQTDSKTPTKTEITKSNLGLLKEMCAAAGLEEGKKAEMQAALRTHFGYDSDSDSSNKEKKPVQKKVKPVVEEPKPVVEEPKPVVEEEPVSELSAEESAEESDDEEIDLGEGAMLEFEYEGKSYQRVIAEGELLNKVVDEEGAVVGSWNPETEKVEFEEED